MVVTDPIGDMLTRIRNAIKTKASEVEMPSSRVKEDIAKVLKEEGYIGNFEVSAKRNKKALRIHLKYNQRKRNVIGVLKRVSTPGRHVYVGCKNIPVIQGGFGTVIISTSKGIMSDKSARANKLGGELICCIY